MLGSLQSQNKNKTPVSPRFATALCSTGPHMSCQHTPSPSNSLRSNFHAHPVHFGHGTPNRLFCPHLAGPPVNVDPVGPSLPLSSFEFQDTLLSWFFFCHTGFSHRHPHLALKCEPCTLSLWLSSLLLHTYFFDYLTKPRGFSCHFLKMGIIFVRVVLGSQPN